MKIRFGTSVIVAVGICLCGELAFAQGGASDRGAVELGLRVGYGLPAGHEGETATDVSNASVSSDVSGIVPIIVDAGYRFVPNFYLGLSFQYAPGFVNSDQNPGCSQSGVSCSATDLRLGLNAHYHFAPGQSFDPWLGLGIGYEWMLISVDTGLGSADGTVSGFEFANFQLGGDVAVTPDFGLGPFLSVSLGEYSGISTSGATTSVDMDITNKSVHEWFLFGVRGVYDIKL